MKSTKAFKDTIQLYLSKRAEEDELFAVAYAKEGKSIDDCVTYILNQVQQSGCNGFSDDEVYSMAVHYYDEDDIKVGRSVNCKVVVNHVVELTEEEKQKAREDAMKKIEAEQLAKIRSIPKPKAKKTEKQPEVKAEQASLF